MKLALLGGGGFRVPLVVGALLDERQHLIDEVWLHDVHDGRLATMRSLLAQLADGRPGPTIHTTTHLVEAVRGADFVFSAVRAGGLEGRVSDERIALALGVLGQETTGPAGLAYALRTAPVALDIARTVQAEAPQAWVINFTNPAGLVTELMQTVLGDRVIGICDTPSGLGKRVGALFGADGFDLVLDYVGLNHLGWLRHAWWGDRDLVAELLADDERLARLEETTIFGADWLRVLGALPNEYLYYYYFNREAVVAITASESTRGEYLLEQQAAFYAAAQADPTAALRLWHTAHDEREATYMRETRGEGEKRPDLEGGGYERVALALMRAIARNESRTMILNVRNGTTVTGLPDDAVVEVPALVGTAGPRALAVTQPSGVQLGLMQQVKAVERLVIRSVLEADETDASKAFALHPLVDSVTIGRRLFEDYRAAAARPGSGGPARDPSP